MGDEVVVTCDGSAYHGRQGKISSFCLNGSHKQIYVDFADGRNPRKLNTSSLALRRNARAPRTEDSVILPREVHVPASRETSSPASVAMSHNTTRTAATGSTYRDRVLTLYEFVGDLRDEYSEDSTLKFKLREVEKMILGLNLED